MLMTCFHRKEKHIYLQRRTEEGGGRQSFTTPFWDIFLRILQKHFFLSILPPLLSFSVRPCICPCCCFLLGKQCLQRLFGNCCKMLRIFQFVMTVVIVFQSILTWRFCSLLILCRLNRTKWEYSGF